MRTLLIDNYDSYTFNLFHLVGEVTGEEPVVVRNDEAAWAELAGAGYDAIVVSPGPGRPEHPRDVGVSLDALAQREIPVLGVCLGLQALAFVEGGTIGYAPEVMHGRLSPIRHDGTGLFRGLPDPFMAVRYHSLVVAAVPAALRVTARSPDGVVMALADPAAPRWGVQFHPESVCTEDGLALMANFRDLARGPVPAAPRRAPALARPAPAGPPAASGTTVLHRRLGAWRDPEAVVAARHRDADAFVWLDSARAERGLARFSYLGTADGPLGHEIRCDAGAGTVTVTPAGGEAVTAPGDLLDALAARLTAHAAAGPKVPFDFVGGYAGYLGYGLKAACGASAGPAAPQPDAALLFCDRVIAFDHEERRVHLLALADADGAAAAEAWLDATAAALRDVPPAPLAPAAAPGALPFRLREDREAYLERIAAAQAAIHEGETYEVCLTTELRAEGSADPIAAYAALRAANPAPHGALLRLGPLSVLSSSPERFLRVDRDGVVESKPIKGTAARGATPAQDGEAAAALQADEKSRAENLMITDLVRNDLGRVCALGTVRVPALMVVESYATVHQLVSAVRGQLAPGRTALDAVRAAFPPGSMTGAPKLRTLEILDRLEGRARGVYSGALGYLSVNGAADLSVVIRTLVAGPDGLTIGSGGAIVAASDPEAEFEEMLLKAAPLLAAVGGTLAAPAAAP
ncbi:MAG: aminodeoxychorismate synthase component I [Solirubrobacteraceae bacterium]